VAARPGECPTPRPYGERVAARSGEGPTPRPVGERVIPRSPLGSGEGTSHHERADLVGPFSRLVITLALGVALVGFTHFSARRALLAVNVVTCQAEYALQTVRNEQLSNRNPL